MCKNLTWKGMDKGYECKYGIVSVKRCNKESCNYYEEQEKDSE